jgi:N-methylhydantoinase A
MSYTVSVDIGGTATDTVVVDEGGNLTVGKAFSTPPTFVEGVIDSVAVAAAKLDLEPPRLLASASLFLHSTTVGENAIADGTLAKAGLLVTAGTEDILFLTRNTYGRWAGVSSEEIKNPVYLDKPPTLVPPALIKGIRERTDILGNVLLEVDEQHVEAAVHELVESGVEAIGVVFLHSYVNPENERIVGEVIARLYPGLFQTLSHELSAIIGEYERISSVALNVRLGPSVSKYLERLTSSLEQRKFAGEPRIMQAYGGLLKSEDAEGRPTGMIESGPVAGLIGSKVLAERMGYDNVVAADMGGTTFKAGIVRQGVLAYQRKPVALRYPYSVPKMDIVSIGLAGGSIVWLDPRTGAPRIGPKSAGASPGPVCYRRGGTEPTITDVDLILGYLKADLFLEGRATLDLDVALEAFERTVSGPLGLDVLEAAGQMYRLANSFMFDLLHKMTVQRGLDPRGYVLFSYGGTAGMHLGAVAEELQVRRVVIPASASVQGAFGLSSSDVVHEHQASRPMPAVPDNLEAATETLQALRSQAEIDLKSEGFLDDQIVLQCAVEMRYRRQVHELTTPVELNGHLESSDLDRLVGVFEHLYQEQYGEGSALTGSPIEFVTFRVRGTGVIDKPALAEYELHEDAPSPSAIVETRQVYIDHNGTKGLTEVAGYDFDKLEAGNRITGPAIIWTPITTVVVQPGHQAELDKHKTITLSWERLQGDMA